MEEVKNVVKRLKIESDYIPLEIELECVRRRKREKNEVVKIKRSVWTIS